MSTEQTEPTTFAQQPAPAPAQSAPMQITSDDSCSCFQSFFTYMSILFALMVVCVKRNKTNVYLRFNAFQAIYMVLVVLAVNVIVCILAGGLMLMMMVMEGGFMWMVLSGFVYFAGTIFLLVLSVMSIIAMIKAYSGSPFKIPVIGNMAEKSATKYVR